MAAGIATYIGNEKWYEHVVMPTFRLLNPETAHWLALKCAKYGIIPHMKPAQHEALVRIDLLHLNVIMFCFFINVGAFQVLRNGITLNRNFCNAVFFLET